MTRRTRTILFSFFVVLFFLIIIPLILYSQGYRFDLKKKEMVQTGGIFLKTSLPQQAEVFLDGKKIKNKITPLFHRTLIQNLIPKIYKIELREAGYHSWTKFLKVEGQMVAESKNILLVPKTLKKTVIAEKVEKFWFSPDGEKIALVIQTGNEKKLAILNLVSNEIGEIPNKFSEISQIKWSPDSQKLVFLTNEGWKFSNGVDLRNLPINSDPKWNPWDNTKLFFLSDKNDLLGLTISQSATPSLPLISRVDFYDIWNNEIYWLEKNTGLVFKINGNGIKKQLTYLPLNLRGEGKFIFSFNNLGVLKGNTFFLFNPNKNLMEEISEPVKEAKFSPDGKKMLLLSQNEIWVYWLEDILVQPYHYQGDKEFITRFSKNISQALWYPDGEHILFVVQDKIKITELDGRDPRNIVDFLSGEKPELFFNLKAELLYILDRELLSAISL